MPLFLGSKRIVFINARNEGVLDLIKLNGQRVTLFDQPLTLKEGA